MTPTSESLAEVTVVIPTRNRWGLVGRALSSVLRQEDVDLEVVLVDDGSTKPMPEDHLAWRDPRVRVIGERMRGGVARARNLGIAHCRTEWVAFLDDDDIWSPHKLRLQLDAVRARRAAFAYGSAVVVDGVLRVRHYLPAAAPEGIQRELLVRNVVPGGCSNVMARTDLVRQVGGFDERFSVLADWDLWIRLALAAPAASCSDVVVAYLSHPGNMVVEGEYDTLREFRGLVEKHRDASRAANLRFDRSRVYRYFARGHRRAGRRVAAAGTYFRLVVADRSSRDLARALGALVGFGSRRLPETPDGSYPSTPTIARPAWLSIYE